VRACADCDVRNDDALLRQHDFPGRDRVFLRAVVCGYSILDQTPQALNVSARFSGATRLLPSKQEDDCADSGCNIVAVLAQK
jgi:hypothetical protein